MILLLDEEDDVLVGRAAVGLADGVLDGIRVPVGAGVAGRIAATREPLIVPDLAEVDVHSAYLRESARSMAGVPLLLEGRVIGVLHVSSDQLDRFGESDLSLLVPAAERAALAIARARVAERERRIAETLQRSLLPEVLPAIGGLRPGRALHPRRRRRRRRRLVRRGAAALGRARGRDRRRRGEGAAGGDADGRAARGAARLRARGRRIRATPSRAWTGSPGTTVIWRRSCSSTCTPSGSGWSSRSAGHLPPLVLHADGRASS